MADFDMVIVDAGVAAQAAALANGSDFPLDRIKIGRGQYTPNTNQVDIMTPFNPTRELANPAGIVVENDTQFTFMDSGADNYDVGEIAIFSGNTLYAIGSNPAAFLFSKAANTPLLVPIAITILGQDITNITFNNSSPIPLATVDIDGIIRLTTVDIRATARVRALIPNIWRPKSTITSIRQNLNFNNFVITEIEARYSSSIGTNTLNRALLVAVTGNNIGRWTGYLGYNLEFSVYPSGTIAVTVGNNSYTLPSAITIAPGRTVDFFDAIIRGYEVVAT